MELFKLFGTILIDDKASIDSLKKVNKGGETTAKKLNTVANKGLAIGTAIVGAGILAVGALKKITDGAAETTDRIDKLSQRLGLSREGFQKWDFVLSQAGVDIQSLQTGMKTFSQKMGDVLDGVGPGIELFEKLGVTITDSMTQEEAFEMTVTALQNMEDGIEKAAIAQELFGKQGQELLPLLNSTAASTEELMLQAEALGLVLSDEAINAGVQYTDSLDQATRSTDVLKTNIGIMLMPTVQSMLDWFILHMPEIKVVVENAFTKINDGILWISDNADILIPILEGLLAAFVGLKIIAIITGMMEAYSKMTVIATGVATLFNAALWLNPMTYVVIGAIALIAIIAVLILKWEEVTDAISDAWDWLMKWNDTTIVDKNGKVNIEETIKHTNARYGFGYASGTTHARRGPAWAGEHGPELIFFNGGETVIPNRQSEEMAARSQGGITLNNCVFNVRNERDIDLIGEQFQAQLQIAARAGGLTL